MPKQKDEPKDHHYVPAFYLREWEQPETGKLVEFRKLPGKLGVKEVSAKSTGYQRFLYSHATDDPNDMDHTFESEYLSSLDSDAAGALKAVNAPVPQFTHKVKEDWSRLIVSLMMRSPEDVNAFKECGEFINANPSQMRLRLIDRLCEDLNIDPQVAQEVMADISPQDIEGIAFQSLGHLMETSTLIPALCSMTWHVRDLANARNTLLTSDRPILTNNQLTLPSGMLAMPVSPSRILILHGGRSADADHLRHSSENEAARSCNRLTVEAARKYVWSTNSDQEKFVGNRIGKRTRHSVSEIALLSAQESGEPLSIEGFIKTARRLGAID